MSWTSNKKQRYWCSRCEQDIGGQAHHVQTDRCERPNNLFTIVLFCQQVQLKKRLSRTGAGSGSSHIQRQQDCWKWFSENPDIQPQGWLMNFLNCETESKEKQRNRSLPAPPAESTAASTPNRDCPSRPRKLPQRFLPTVRDCCRRGLSEPSPKRESSAVVHSSLTLSNDKMARKSIWTTCEYQ